MAVHRDTINQLAATSLAALSLFMATSAASQPFLDKALATGAQGYEAQIKKALAPPQLRAAAWG